MMKRQRSSSVGPLPTGRAIDVLVQSLISLDDELSAIDMDHAVRSQYSFVVKKWLVTSEGQIIDKLVDRVAEQNSKGEKARRVLNEIIHKIPPLNAEDHHHHHGHVISNVGLNDIEKDHIIENLSHEEKDDSWKEEDDSRKEEDESRKDDEGSLKIDDENKGNLKASLDSVEEGKEQ